MQIICIDTPATTAVAELARCLTEAGKRPVLLLLSGGSWLAALDTWDDLSVLSPRVTIGMLDERFSTNPTINNFAQLLKTDFYARASEAGAAFIDSRAQSGETHASYTTRYVTALHTWRQTHPDGVVLVTLGMGEDGHTAGLFPDSLALTSTDWVTAAEVPATVNPHPLRTTVTPHFLQTEVTAAVALVTGPAKCAVLAEVMDSPADAAKLPAHLWHTMPNITVVTNCVLNT